MKSSINQLLTNSNLISMSIKKELLKTYVNRIADFQHIHELCPDGKHGPLFMSPAEMYATQPYPFLVVGKETYGWEKLNYPVTQEDCSKMMEAYENFNVGIDYYGSPFWNVTRKIEKVLGNEPYSCAWTNISKYDQNGGHPDAEHEKIFSIVDDILADEIQIIKPKICIFCTSHYFDYRIENIFKTVEFLPVDGFAPYILCQLRHKQLPVLTFRTYHPNYLRRSGIEEQFIEFINSKKITK